MRLERPVPQRFGQFADVPRRGRLETLNLRPGFAVRERRVPHLAPRIQQPLLREGPDQQLTHGRCRCRKTP